MEALLKAIGADADKWSAVLAYACHRFQIEEPEQKAAFLANAAHESQGFKVLQENLNYSWSALLAQWGKRFTPETAVRVGRVDKVLKREGLNGVYHGPLFVPTEIHAADVQAIANIAYGNRMGNTGEGDGWRFRGRGIFQLTGRSNYTQYFQALGEEGDPELLLQPQHAALSAAWYWASRNLNQVLKTQGFTKVCQAINGGLIGIDQRTAAFNKLLTVIGGTDVH